jgi:hypothetical protein
MVLVLLYLALLSVGRLRVPRPIQSTEASTLLLLVLVDVTVVVGTTIYWSVGESHGPNGQREQRRENRLFVHMIGH